MALVNTDLSDLAIVSFSLMGIIILGSLVMLLCGKKEDKHDHDHGHEHGHEEEHGHGHSHAEEEHHHDHEGGYAIMY